MLTKREIVKYVNESIRIDSSQLLSDILKHIRGIEDSKVKEDLVVYVDDLFRKVSWRDISFSRVVARYKDIMICLDFFEHFDDSQISKDISNLKKIIKELASVDELDRVIYVRVFHKGLDNLKNGVTWQKGYVDKYHEFNEDILDIINVSLENIEEKLNNGNKLDNLEKIFQPLVEK